MTPNEDDQVDDASSGRRIRFGTVLLGFLLIVVTFAAAALYLSTEIKLQKAETRAAEAREALLAAANAATAAQAAELLKMAALPLSWAVRQELQEKNYREIALYFQQLAGLAGVRHIALISRDGNVKLATDTKLEGRSAGEAFPGVALEDDAPAVRSTGAKGLEAIVPIMGLNTRLGTLVVVFEPAHADQGPAR